MQIQKYIATYNIIRYNEHMQTNFQTCSNKGASQLAKHYNFVYLKL